MSQIDSIVSDLEHLLEPTARPDLNTTVARALADLRHLSPDNLDVFDKARLTELAEKIEWLCLYKSEASTAKLPVTTAQIDAFLDSPCHILSPVGTWRDWFRRMLRALVADPGNFSGKRPGCNSGWYEHLAASLTLLDPGVVTSWDQETDGRAVRLPWEVDETRLRTAFGAVIDHLLR